MMRSLARGAFTLMALLSLPATEAPTAGEEFKAYQAAVAKDVKAKDWKAYLLDAQRLKTFLNDSPTSRLEVARAYLRLGENEAALAETEGFLRLHETNDILSSAVFQPISANLQGQLKANAQPVSSAHQVFQLDDAALVPEDIDYDANSKRFFLTTILGKSIVVVNATGVQSTFANAPDDWPMVALKVDARRRRLWATEVAFTGFKTVPEAAWGRSVLLLYDLDTGKLMRRWEAPPHAALGDMVLAGKGEPIVSDGDGGGVYRVEGTALRRIDHGDFLSPQTVAICRDDQTLLAPDYVRGLARLDIKTGRVTWFHGDQHALDGIDGLYCDGDTLFAVQNGATPARVVKFGLDAARSTVTSELVIEQAAAGFGTPTHGVLVNGNFFYIANSGWDELDEHGQVAPGSHLTPAMVMQADGTNN